MKTVGAGGSSNQRKWLHLTYHTTEHGNDGSRCNIKNSCAIIRVSYTSISVSSYHSMLFTSEVNFSKASIAVIAFDSTSQTYSAATARWTADKNKRMARNDISIRITVLPAKPWCNYTSLAHCGGRLHDSFIMHCHISPSPFVMVWGIIGSYSQIALIRIAGTRNSHHYISKV